MGRGPGRGTSGEGMSARGTQGAGGTVLVPGEDLPYIQLLEKGVLAQRPPKQAPQANDIPPTRCVHARHSRSAWSVGARWDVALPFTMVSAVRCAKRARAPTSPAASAGQRMCSGAASPGHRLPCPGGCTLPLKALKDRYESLERSVSTPLAYRLLLERAHGNPPTPPAASLHHQGIARLPMAQKQLGAAGCIKMKARCR